MHPIRQTIVDFPSSTYLDKGGETYRLASCIRSGGEAYIAAPVPAHEEVAMFQRWLLPEPGWVVGCFSLHPQVQPVPWDWYIDLATVDTSPEAWRVSDHYIDVTVFDGQRYELLDLDEFAEALEEELIPIEVGIATLRSSQRLCAELEELNFSVPALLERHAPSLPAFQPWETVTVPQ
ncbi:MAG: DUF402 domain-containing protein [Dehalococcoidia bacterium]|jgi:uncharacterized protein|nr:DUF402 domain-containing protein [Dehalococcoidia bacterium]